MRPMPMLKKTISNTTQMAAPIHITRRGPLIFDRAPAHQELMATVTPYTVDKTAMSLSAMFFWPR
jgi:hypothetical protein